MSRATVFRLMSPKLPVFRGLWLPQTRESESSDNLVCDIALACLYRGCRPRFQRECGSSRLTTPISFPAAMGNNAVQMAGLLGSQLSECHRWRWWRLNALFVFRVDVVVLLPLSKAILRFRIASCWAPYRTPAWPA